MSAEPQYRTIDGCRLCGAESLTDVLDLGTQPLANSLVDDTSGHEAMIPLEMVYCRECGLAQLSVDVDPAVMFRDYVWVTGTSASTREYCQGLADWIMSRVSVDAPRVFEMASNDGTLLQTLADRGARVLGIDPAVNLATDATARGVETIPDFLTSETATQIEATRGKFDVVIARNVMSHVPDPLGAIEALSRLTVDDGLVLIEFHSAQTILEELHYDSIYHEHTMYHSLHTMQRLMSTAGLKAFDVRRSPISGGSWALLARKTDVAPPITGELSEALEYDRRSGIGEESAWLDFGRRAEGHRDQLSHEIARLSESGQPMVAYGASARSSTMLNYLGPVTKALQAIADASPLKHGKYSPGVNIPIVSPQAVLEMHPHAILLFAFNFEDEILRFLKDARWKGEVVVPFPGDPRVFTLTS
ncbi:MAG: class I SAM-dependent methyltransferase [Mycobacterium sp.]